MINPFQQLGELKKMRDQALTIQRKLQQEEVVVEKNGVRVVMTGDQKIKELNLGGRGDTEVKEAINEAIKKSQEIAARKLSQMGGGFQGLLGK